MKLFHINVRSEHINLTNHLFRSKVRMNYQIHDHKNKVGLMFAAIIKRKEKNEYLTLLLELEPS